MNIFFKHDCRIKGGQGRSAKNVRDSAENILFSIVIVLLGFAFFGILKLLEMVFAK